MATGYSEASELAQNPRPKKEQHFHVTLLSYPSWARTNPDSYRGSG